MCCSMLQYSPWVLHESVQVCCSVLQYGAVCCSVFLGCCTKVLRCVAEYFSVLHQVALFLMGFARKCEGVLQCVAVYCSMSQFFSWFWHKSVKTLHHTATHCNSLQHMLSVLQLSVMVTSRRMYWWTLAVSGYIHDTLQHTVPHCTTLHHTATHGGHVAVVCDGAVWANVFVNSGGVGLYT